jgi:RNA methyltransferase, TrmH family
LDGVHLVMAARDAGISSDLLVVTKRSRVHPEVAAQLAVHQGDVIELSDRLFKTLSSTHPEVGLLSRIDYPKVLQTKQAFVLILEEIQDPGNLGNILRTAAAADVDTVYLSRGCADPYSPRVLRAGQGAHFVLPIHEQVDVLTIAKEFNGEIIVTTPVNGTSLYDTDLVSPLAIAFGNEGSGISPALMALATRKICIPMPGKIESLNVAASVAVCLFERVRQSRII